MKTALLFGGAFNPPTIAHIELAEFALKETGRDCVIFVPTKNSYISDTQGKEYAFSNEERLFLLDAIAKERPWMEVSRYEIEAEKQPRTYETLCHYRDLGYQVSLLFGSDKLGELETVWRYMEEICHEFGIVCMKRSDDPAEEMLKNDPYLKTLAPYIQLIETPEKTRSVSSTTVRRLLAGMRESWKSLADLLPDELEDTMSEFVKTGRIL